MKHVICTLFLVGCSSGPSKGFLTEVTMDGGSPDTSAGVSCSYPSGPFGSAPGSFVRSDLSWACAGTDVSSSELFDCDGKKGINAIVFDVSAEWCAACVAEAADFKTLAPQYEKLGVKAVTLMVQDGSYAPATLSAASEWKQKFNLTIDVCADPSFAFQPSGSGSVTLPVAIVVDPRTMRIVHVSQGYVSHYPLTPAQIILDLVEKNAAAM